MSSATADVCRSPRATACIHCGLPSETGVRDAHDNFYCCRGCLTAHQLLEDLADSQCNTTARPTCRTYEEMDDPSFISRYVKSIDSNASQITFASEDFQCSSCLQIVERLPRLLKGVLAARVNSVQGTATITWLTASLSVSQIARKLDQLGFQPSPFRVDERVALERVRSRQEVVQLAIAGVCAGNAMLIAIALYAGLFTGMDPAHLSLFRAVSALLGIISVAGPGRIFFSNAWRALRLRSPHMDLPVALGVGIGTLDGIYRVFTQTGEIYFDSISTLVFLLLTGRFIQSQQKRRALDRVSLLKCLTPDVARVIRDGQTRMVPADGLVVEDVVEVRTGEVFPADGRLSDGQTLVDESLLTGESSPRRVVVGDSVTTGTTNLGSAVSLIVTSIGQQTRLGKLLQLMDDALAEKSTLVQFSDRIGGWFILTVLLLAVVNLTLWWNAGADRAIEQTVAMLIVACPCALGLATPLVMAVFQGAAAKQGILIKSSEAIERLAGKAEVWLDKTGTVTTGQLTVIDWLGDESAKAILLAVEKQVQHPIARALVKSLTQDLSEFEIIPHIQNMEVVPGRGMKATVDGFLYGIGSRKWMDQLGVTIPQTMDDRFIAASHLGQTSVFVATDQAVTAMAVMGDSLRPGTKSLVSSLQSQGWEVGMLSGDDPQVVRHIASNLGIPPQRQRGGATPEQKLAIIKDRNKRGHVIMVGDGINDSASLMAADVGIAVNGGAEASMHAADIYLSRGDVTSLADLMTGCRQAMRRIYLNFAISLGYNILAVSLAMVGWIHPLVAALLMPLSSITVLSVALSPGQYVAGTQEPKS